MSKLLKVASVLLCYPGEELKGSALELKAALASDPSVNERERKALCRLIDDIAARDVFDAQERYVHLFDRTRSLSLHLFEHVHGESRDRGQAMVDLLELYESKGFSIEARELPDYLPLFLEFLSTQPEEDSKELLGQIAHILDRLTERLRKRRSVYVNATAVLAGRARRPLDVVTPAASTEPEDDDPDDLEALDRVWEEEAVRFGANAGDNSCGPDRLRMQIRAAARRVDPGATQSAID